MKKKCKKCALYVYLLNSAFQPEFGCSWKCAWEAYNKGPENVPICSPNRPCAHKKHFKAKKKP